MSFKKLLGNFFLFGFLQIAQLAGARITPEEVEKLLNIMNRTQVVQIKKQDDDPEL